MFWEPCETEEDTWLADRNSASNFPAQTLVECLPTSTRLSHTTNSAVLNPCSPSRKPQDPAPQTERPAETGDAHMETSAAEPPTAPAAMAAGNRKRPRLDLSDPRERKRGKSVFGMLVGTLNKAKNEDKQRGATEAVRASVYDELNKSSYHSSSTAG